MSYKSKEKIAINGYRNEELFILFLCSPLKDS